MTTTNDKNSANKSTTAFFIIYLVVLLWIVLLKLGVQFSYMEARRVNLVPFREAILFKGGIDFTETILNVLIFIPPGVYTGILFQGWRFGKKLALVFLMSLSIEILQFILRIGALDITDIITNTSGGLIGLALFSMIVKVYKDHSRAQKFINVVAGIGTVLLVFLLLLLKLNRLPIRYQ